jgi:hypothetical protein
MTPILIHVPFRPDYPALRLHGNSGPKAVAVRPSPESNPARPVRSACYFARTCSSCA